MSQTSPGPAISSHKILGRHHERLAVVYVRQSSLHQVQQNQESTQLQYGLVHTAKRMGWPRERVLVIDDAWVFRVHPPKDGLVFSACSVRLRWIMWD